MNYKQLTFAREYRGYTQTELSNSIEGLSQSNLSKFEKGMGVLSETLIDRIIDFLKFPKEFFNRKINNSIENANYRKKATAKYLVDEFETKCKVIGYIIDLFADDITFPVFSLSPMDVEAGFSPVKIANYTRRLLKVSDDEPLRNIYSIFEEHGIMFYEIDANEKFDGVSFTTDFGIPIVIINKNMPNDRKRFTIAHEIGHLLMHNESNYPVSSFRDKEKEANEFASELLMPETAIKNQLFQLKMGDLAGLKQYWGTSMASITRRARDLRCIDENRYRFFNIELSRLGLKKNEGVNVPIDSPDLFVRAKELLENELGYTIKEFKEILALPDDILIDLIPNKSSNVKIIKLNR